MPLTALAAWQANKTNNCVSGLHTFAGLHVACLLLKKVG